MFRHIVVILAGGLAIVAATDRLEAAGSQQPATSDRSSTVASQSALIDQYCVTCHNERTKAGSLVLAGVDLTKVDAHTDIWERVVRKLRAGMMPPVGMPRPSAPAQEALVTWLESELDGAAKRAPNPGRTEAFHRLNRAEYRNAIRDLLALDIDVESLLPSDDAGYGFDNIAGVLKISQSLMERYLSVAKRVSREVVGNNGAVPIAETFPLSAERLQYNRAEGLPFGTRGGALIPYSFPRNGEYTIRAEFSCALVETAGCDASAGFDDLHQLEYTIDGERVQLFSMIPKPKGRSFDEDKSGVTQDLRWQVRVAVQAGLRDVGVAFLKLPSVEMTDWPRVRFSKPFYEGNMVPQGSGIYQPHIASITIAGPFNPTEGRADTPSRRRVFVCEPKVAADELPCARQILSTLARRAYRRPVNAADVQSLVAFYEAGRRDGGDFDDGIEMALRALLASPEFIYRVEGEPAQGGPAKIPTSAAPASAAPRNYNITDLELASRLSFFIWSSIPDDELLDVAAAGRLRNPAALERQIQRMLADQRAEALAVNFLEQWLNLRKLQFASPADPDFDDSLRDGFQQETRLFFNSIIRENRSVLDLLTGDFTYLNERVALHYRIPNVKGSHFRRVKLPADSPRRGLLGHGSILTSTSHAIRTSPVIRGKWILETLLGTPPPPPPASVPPLAEKTGSTGKVLSMRERMAEHRANPVCAGCHSMIDPMGFALENFDPVGRWRDLDVSMSPVDASGSFPDGSKFVDLGSFRAVLASRPEQFVTALTQKLLTYALGRGLESYDMPAVRTIARDAGRNDYRFSSLIEGIAKSVPFQMRRSLSAAESLSAARH